VSDRLERYLDGEVGIEALDPTERAEARAWDAMFVDLRSTGGRTRAPRALADRVMAELGLEGAAHGGAAAPAHGSAPEPAGHGGLSGFWRAVTWPFRPIRVPVPPALALAAGAALALLVFVWRSGGIPLGTEVGSGVVQPASLKAPAAPARVYIEFRFDAPGASSVAVAGDFDDWQPTVALQDPDGDGVWTGLVPMSPGVHQYMFVVDGTKWVTDPGAARHVDDGFGHRNAIVAVPSPAGA
jgi:hypothetical protein